MSKMSQYRRLENGNLEVYTNWGPAELKADGTIDHAAEMAFTRGHCHAFALAMHRETGWPMFGVGPTPNHFLVYCPSLDTYIDIDGPGAELRWKYLFEGGQKMFNAEQVMNELDCYCKCMPEIAEPFVKRVLADLLPIVPLARGAAVTKDSLTLTGRR